MVLWYLSCDVMNQSLTLILDGRSHSRIAVGYKTRTHGGPSGVNEANGKMDWPFSEPGGKENFMLIVAKIARFH